jgi:hypothetical protein
MNEEDEAFEELSRKQGYWGLQGSRKHQIMRYAENVESKENITQDELFELANQAGKEAGLTAFVFHPVVEIFAKLVAEKATAKEREACAKVCESLPMQQEIDVRDQCAAAIRARGQA